ncbi:uncharacterized protein PITG_08728 [Phytophthora infestans T30-4]|uniref:Uncharacterized protein n=1 Tax=Phytophthora infestans (strain T30-4) TaxID=403677 RepID=D0ND22_PHYIT|nr:uncharacterized protein PITG_08728 [Phytophthora infestans T30-4]EEY55979.1 hypothetical protein PITG_08728 [Phytophthora infestans T30-4]|eukprot:XP_002902809.1 hypothetical protein PITG_08728 [Phytophthora infestans T30-4]
MVDFYHQIQERKRLKTTRTTAYENLSFMKGKSVAVERLFSAAKRDDGPPIPPDSWHVRSHYVSQGKRQLLGAGIIAAFKQRYRRRQIHALDQLEVDPSMDMSKETKLLKVDARQAEEDSEIDEIAKMLSRLPVSDPILVTELLNSPDEDVYDKPTDENFCEIIVEDVPANDKSIGACEDNRDEAENDNVEIDSADTKEHLKKIAKLLFQNDSTGVSDSSSFRPPSCGLQCRTSPTSTTSRQLRSCRAGSSSPGM